MRDWLTDLVPFLRRESKTATGSESSRARRDCDRATAAPAPVPHAHMDEFLSWILGRVGLSAAAYRPQPLTRRLPACFRAIKVDSPYAARELLERQPQLLAKAVSSLLIGTTEFFREPDAFDFLRAQALPALAGSNRRLRIWSAACSTGAELYSVAMLLSEAGLLERSCLLGTDCRGDAIERAGRGLYDAPLLKLVPRATREQFFEPAGGQWRPIEPLRRQVHWKVADLLAGVEEGPWDIILWRNAAIYLQPCPADSLWRRLVSVLAPGGLLIAGKADRPPHDAGLTPAARCVYRLTGSPVRRRTGGAPLLLRPLGENAAGEPVR